MGVLCALYGWQGVLRASSILFFAYLGFETVSTAAAETKDPQRAMPIGILGALGASTLIDRRRLPPINRACAVWTGIST